MNYIYIFVGILYSIISTWTKLIVFSDECIVYVYVSLSFLPFSTHSFRVLSVWLRMYSHLSRCCVLFVIVFSLFCVFFFNSTHDIQQLVFSTFLNSLIREQSQVSSSAYSCCYVYHYLRLRSSGVQLSKTRPNQKEKVTQTISILAQPVPNKQRRAAGDAKSGPKNLIVQFWQIEEQRVVSISQNWIHGAKPCEVPHKKERPKQVITIKHTKRVIFDRTKSKPKKQINSKCFVWQKWENRARDDVEPLKLFPNKREESEKDEWNAKQLLDEEENNVRDSSVSNKRFVQELPQRSQPLYVLCVECGCVCVCPWWSNIYLDDATTPMSITMTTRVFHL